MLGNLAGRRVPDSASGGDAAPLGAVGVVRATVHDKVPCAALRGGWLEAAGTGFNAAADFTQEVWLRPDPASLRLERRILDRITPGGTDGFLLDFNAGQLRGMVPGCPTISVPICFEGWMHLALVRAGNQASVFINGQPAAAYAASHPAKPVGQLQFTGEAPAPSQNTPHFPALRSPHELSQRPSPQKQIPSIHFKFLAFS
jgi:hypothetical protein